MLFQNKTVHPTQLERKKILLLCFAACFIAACYAILRPLKASVFFQIVGKEYYPLTKFLMAIIALPSIALYSKLVDHYKKHTILYILFSIYTGLCFLFAILLSHPVIGIPNTQPSAQRLLGWAFTITIDFYPTFIIGTFWAFINSISTNQFAKKSYGIIHAFIKGGSLLATSGCIYITYKSLQDSTSIPLLISISAFLTFFSLFFIAKLIKTIPKSHMIGYSSKDQIPSNSKKIKPVLGIFEGITFMLTKPYVLGIFLLVYCYDVIFTIIEYQTHILLYEKSLNTINNMNFFLFLSATVAEIMGLLLALLLTTRILKVLQLQYGLLIMPLFSVCIIMAILLFPHLITMLAAITLLPAVHYSLNSPMREMLFIPTIKNIQFKSKAWMDSFGRTLSKSSAATINMLFYPGTPIFLLFTSSFSMVLAGIWAIIAHSTGKKYQNIINENEIIGE